MFAPPLAQGYTCPEVRIAMKLLTTSLIALFGLFAAVSCSHLMTNDRDVEKSRLHLQLAADRLNERDYNKALEATQEAIRLDPSSAAAYNHLALIYMETKRFPKSEEAFQGALKIQPEFPEVWNNLGVLYNRQDRYKDAIPFFEKAAASDKYLTPENAYTNLGFAHYKLGDMSRAKAYHQKALDISPQFCLASKNLGDVYAKEKKYPKAAEYFQKAATHCPLFQESQYKLGLVLMKMGQKSVAKNQFEKLIERHKNGPFVDRSNEVLKYLQ